MKTRKLTVAPRGRLTIKENIGTVYDAGSNLKADGAASAFAKNARSRTNGEPGYHGTRNLWISRVAAHATHRSIDGFDDRNPFGRNTI
jgi:hypothetical protein